MPQKTFVDSHVETKLSPLALPDGVTAASAIDRVLRLLSVGSKRFLVHKVDRSVTGLCAQQQCVGPLQLPLANVGVAADVLMAFKNPVEGEETDDAASKPTESTETKPAETTEGNTEEAATAAGEATKPNAAEAKEGQPMTSPAA